MSTATTPESEGSADATASRPARLIQNEATTEIPVHLLFRDDPDPQPVPVRPTVVARRQGTGDIAWFTPEGREMTQRDWES
ncbi:hypothetical protein ACWDTB_07345, partial [Streptomyces sp. NPDC003487]